MPTTRRHLGLSSTDMEDPVLGFALPLRSETHWSNLLAVLTATDPAPLSKVLGLRCDPARLLVRREALVDRANRPDIVLVADGVRVAVVEVKVLAGLGARQLERYREAEPGADVYALVYPERLAVPLQQAGAWQGLTWETVLESYEGSSHPWAAATARAWRSHLTSALPKVGPETRWNDLSEGEDFALAIRTRMAWLSHQVHLPAGLEHDLVPSSAGVSWVARLYAKTQLPDYWIMTDVEENLPVRDYPPLARAGGTKPRGPSAKVCLYRHGVRTSAGFNWEHLLRLWPVMDQARADWVQHAARPKARHDRDGHERIVAAGAPSFLGIGFGDAQARINKTCMFGARVQFPGDITLAQMSKEFAALGELTLQLAQVASPCSQPALLKHPEKVGSESARPSAHFRRSVCQSACCVSLLGKYRSG